MATEIGKLTAIFEADSSRFEAAAKRVERAAKNAANTVDRSTRDIASSMKGASRGSIDDPLEKLKSEWAGRVGALRSDLDDLSKTIAGTSQATSGFAASLASAAGPLAVFAVALGAGAIASIKLHTSLLDLSVSSTKTLAELANLSDKYGVSVETVSAAQIIAAQTGRTMADVLSDTRAELDQAIDRFREAGVIMGRHDVEAARALNNELVLLEYQWRAVGIEIGRAITPHTAELVRQLSNALRDNKEMVDSLAGAVGGLAWALGTRLANDIRIATFGLALLQQKLAPIIGLMQFIGGLSGQTGNIPIQQNQYGVGGAATLGAGLTTPKGRVGGGGGGGRGGGIDPGVSLLQQMQKEFFNLTKHTRLEEVQNQLLEKQYARTRDQMKKNIMVMAIEIDLFKQAQADFDSMVRLVQQLGEAGEKGFVRARRAGQPLLQDLEKMLELSQQMAEGLTRPRTQGTRTRPRRVGEGSDLVDLGGGSFFGEGVGGNRERFVTDAEISRRQAMEDLRERMRDLAVDITYTLDNAIYEGFRGGAKRGLATLALGFLDMIQQVILGQLKNAIAQALTTGASGGGGWLSKILGIVIGGAAGGIGGGGGGKVGGTNLGGSINLPGFRAAGGPVSANRPYIVGERGPELFIPGSNGKIAPNAGTTVNNINVTWEQKGMQTFRQNRSRREMAERIAGLLAT